MFHNYPNTLKFIKVVVQWGCVGHCTFEYIGDFVTVIFSRNFHFLFKQKTVNKCLIPVFWPINGTNITYK